MRTAKAAVVFLFAVLCLIPSSAGLPRQEELSAWIAPASASLSLTAQSLPGKENSVRPVDPKILTLMNNLPLYFVENRGQVDRRVRFYTKIKHGTAYFADEEIVYQFLLGDTAQDPRSGTSFPTAHGVSASKTSLGKIPPIREETVRVTFVGADQRARPEGKEEQEARFNYYSGHDPRAWVSGAPSYAKAVYRDLYPGIDLVVSGGEGRLKNEYVVRAGADAAAIRLRYEGARALRVNAKGQLEIHTSAGMLIEDVPLSYQFRDGKKTEVATEYEIADDQTVRFRVDEYSRDAELVIDPLAYATFLGGSSSEYGYAIAVDGSGNAYITGYTTSSDLPTTSGAFDTSYNSSGDAFITKLNPSGSALVYSTFLGGTAGDYGHGIAVDSLGNAYVTGYTGSGDFPVTSGAYDTSLNGSNDVFIGKLDSTGGVLLYLTFLGGTADEYGFGIAVDGSGNPFVTGATASGDFPATSGAFDTGWNGANDVFVTKLNSSGSALVYSMFLGGTGNEYGLGIVLDGSAALLTGQTDSNDFPTTSGAYDRSFNGSVDVFVAKLNSSGNALSYSTFLGGTGNDLGAAIANDGSGKAHVAGFTNSSDFPVTTGAYDSSYNGGYDVCIAKFNPAGNVLQYATFLGGMDDEKANGIAVDAAKNIYLAGFTASADFPATAGAFDASQNGATDAFFTKIAAGGAVLLESTFLGGIDSDCAYGIAVDGVPNATVVGYTTSVDFPTTSGAYDASLGVIDAFVVKFAAPIPDIRQPISAVDFGNVFLGGSADLATTIYNDGYGSLTVNSIALTSGSGDFTFVGPTTPFTIAAGSSQDITMRFTPASEGAKSAVFNVNSDDPDESDVTFAVSGTGITIPDIRTPIAAISFGNVEVGSTSDLTTTIYNDGTGTLTVNSVTRSSGSTEFAFTGPTVPFTIAAGGSQNVTVRFAPASGGAKSAVFNVNSDDPDEADVTFDATGTGIVVTETISNPDTPSGPTSGFVGTSYAFTTGGSTSNLGHDVQYFFDWGDGTDSGWLPVGTASAQKSWSSAGPYNVTAKARCAAHTTVESSTSSPLAVTISVPEYDSSPSNYQVLPECIWSPATGGGTWLSEVQITDITGGSVVSAVFDYGGGNRRGPFTLWTSPGADQNVKYANILSSIDALDSEAFAYYGRVGAVEFSTQDTSHKIQVVARTLNGDYSKTFPGLNLKDSNTADTTRRMILQNFVNNATYRSTCGFFNPTADSVSMELRLVDENGNTVGSTFGRTLVGHDYQAFSPFNQAGVPYPSYSYDNVVLWVTPTSGSGKVMVFGASANNTSNDPAAHIGVQYQGTFNNAPGEYQVIPECIWSPATGGGTWLSEVQITDITGGSVVSVVFDYGAGNRRGPFTLWSSPGADRNVKYANILSAIDALDSEAFTYYGRVGAVEFMTQDGAHKIQVAARTLNGDYSKTLPGLNPTDANTANTSRRMMIQNFANNATYRSTCGFFNPTADAVTLELKLIDGNGSQIGSTVTRTLVGHDFQAFSPFNQAGVPYPSYSYDNVVLWITPTSGAGKVMVFGASANNTSNDPAAHIGVQSQ